MTLCVSYKEHQECPPPLPSELNGLLSMEKHSLVAKAKSRNDTEQTMRDEEWQKMRRSWCASFLNGAPPYKAGKWKIHHRWSEKKIQFKCRSFPSERICRGRADHVSLELRQAGTTCFLWFNRTWWGRMGWIRVSAGGGHPSLKAHIRHKATDCYCFMEPSHRSKPRGTGLTFTGRQRWLVEEEETRVEGSAPEAMAEQMLGGWHFGRGWELVNANYCAKLLAKYVSASHSAW